MTITLVTGNPNKLRELQAVFPDNLDVAAVSLDISEIQSLDLHEIVHNKLRSAYEQIKRPVIVEDVSAEIEKLQGLPGPFIKFFEEQLGRGALYKLAGEGSVKIICCMGFFDGEREIIVDGILEGTIVSPRGTEGFGFDVVVVPKGHSQTLAELGLDTKNKISHRRKAALLLSKQIQAYAAGA
jgi:non-canonical purine NTP pyrophosphatase (RdgB/HAM1 family)